jgi:RNA polymerase sigma-70 factor (ECF subfamily)
MTCDELYQRLTEHAEGVLDADVCQEVDKHLAGCEDCRMIRSDLEDLSRLCREQEPVRLPDEVRQRILALIES